MKPSFQWFRYLVAILILAGWVFLLNYSFFTHHPMVSWLLIAFVPGLLLFFYFFTDPELFLFSIIFFVPLSVKTDLPGGFSISVPSELLAVMCILLFIIHYNTLRNADRRIFRYPLFIVLVLILLWQLICSSMSVLPLVSFKRTIINIIYVGVFFFLFLTRFNQPAKILKFYLFYAVGLVIPIINGMIWHSQYHFNPQASYYMPQPFYIEHTIYGASIVFLIPALFYLAFVPNDFNRSFPRKLFFGLLLALCLTAEFLAFSRAAWLSLAMVPLFLVIFRSRIRFIFLFLIALAAICISLIYVDPILGYFSRNVAQSNRGSIRQQVQSISNIQTDISNLERINRWKCAIRMFKDRPLTGFGPGTYQFEYYKYQLRNEMTYISTVHGEKGNSHSEYLGALAETGVPGFILFLASIFLIMTTAFRIIYNTRDKAIRALAITVTLCLIPYYLHAVFNGFLENDEVGSLYYGSLAAISAIDLYFFRKQA